MQRQERRRREQQCGERDRRCPAPLGPLTPLAPRGCGPVHFTARPVMTRPIWRLMHELPAFRGSLRGELRNAEWLETRLVNLPSSVTPP